MIILTYKLEKYIRKIVFPKILVDTNNYIIKGNFDRRIPYITYIDIVYPNINKSNI